MLVQIRRLLRIALFGNAILLSPLICWADTTQKGTANATQVAIDLTTAPSPLRGLAECGQVSFEFYERQTGEFPGETRFTLDTQYQYRFSSETRTTKGRRIAVINLQINDIDVDCKNKIVLPATMLGERFWTNSLVVHEFEHVRLNCDKRPKLLVKHLLKRIDRLELRLQANDVVAKAMVSKLIETRVSRVREEVIRVMQANNDKLDELTAHGARKLEDPEVFFEQLYTLKNLADCEFAYLSDVKSLLKTDGYAATE